MDSALLHQLITHSTGIIRLLGTFCCARREMIHLSCSPADIEPCTSPVGLLVTQQCANYAPSISYAVQRSSYSLMAVHFSLTQILLLLIPSFIHFSPPHYHATPSAPSSPLQQPHRPLSLTPTTPLPPSHPDAPPNNQSENNG